jgi:hypothetical protein
MERERGHFCRRAVSATLSTPERLRRFKKIIHLHQQEQRRAHD